MLHDLSEWLKKNTYHHTAFRDIKKLVEEKERQGLRISLCIPTLNEERTIGKEVVIFRSELMQRYPLIDELAVIDSGSSDKTLEIADAFGADVYLSSKILPKLGEKKGKGENLWKAVYQLSGDIIVYVDADITNIHARFVYGLVAPLIYQPTLKYVKAFYDRPLAYSPSFRQLEGGRVTEILIRPLFSLFFPELTVLLQPLSGEYAVRREVLEKIPFPVGYGVETSHLLDVYRLYGLDAFAQTDLDQRVHRNQSTRELGRMAFGILRTFWSRLYDMGVSHNLADIGTVLRQFYVHEGEFCMDEHEIFEEERPPMESIPEYANKDDKGK